MVNTLVRKLEVLVLGNPEYLPAREVKRLPVQESMLMLGDFFLHQNPKAFMGTGCSYSPNKLFCRDVLNVFSMLSFSVHTHI